jgi:predicted NAD-dependent protein-ADP-ribosyltransferase YbiA (DUF1768 family)
MITYVKGAGCPMSNFYMVAIPYKGRHYRSLEHLYQCLKVDYHNSNGQYDCLRNQISSSSSGASAKHLARQLSSPSKSWEDQRETLMEDLLLLKADYCHRFVEDLVTSTGFIDHNVGDTFWGTGNDGANVFGLLLVRLRDYLTRRHLQSIITSEDTTNILVLGHSFIRRLYEKIEELQLQFVQPACITGRLQVSYFGIGGANLKSLLSFMKRTQFLSHYPPSVILLQIGGNDISQNTFDVSRFQHDLEELADHCQQFGCQVVFLSIWKRLTVRNSTVMEYNARREQIHRLLRTISGGRNGLLFFSKSSVSRHTMYLDKKGVHPTNAGYVELLNQLSKAVRWVWNENQKFQRNQ